MKEEKISGLGEIEWELSTVYLCPVGGMLLFSDEEQTLVLARMSNRGGIRAARGLLG